MIYVLIVFSTAFSGFVHTQEFNSKENCQTVLEFIQKNGGHMKAGCFPK